MRPIYLNSGTITTSTYYMPMIVCDNRQTPGNATWIVRLVNGTGTQAAIVSLYFTNEDIFAPGFIPPSPGSSGSALWIQEGNAFTNPSSGAATSTANLTTSNLGAVGAYQFLPRAMLFVLNSCVSNPTVAIDFVQASGGIS